MAENGLLTNTVLLLIFALSKFRGKPTRDHSAGVLISRMRRGAKFRPAAIEMTALWDKVNW